MNCHQTRQLVSAYLDQELTGQQMIEIRAHLQHCHACAREWQEIKDVRRLLRALSQPTPPTHAQQELAARLKWEEAGRLKSLSELTLNRLPALWGEFSPQGRRPQGRRTAYALALASVVVLAVAAPFAPSTGDAAAGIFTSHFSRPPASDLQAQESVMQIGLTPSLRLNGAASAIEADPLTDDTISGYVQGDATDATMVDFQTSDNGTR